MSRKVTIDCERKGCKSFGVVTRDKINTLVPGWIQVIHYEKITDVHTGVEKQPEPVLKDLCSADCAAKYFYAMAKPDKQTTES